MSGDDPPSGARPTGTSIRASAEAYALFHGWKPGFLVEAGRLVAIKCKHVAFEDTDAPRTNCFFDEALHAFPDGKHETREAFVAACESSAPVRFALWSDAEQEYADHGWCVARALDGRNRYVFDASEAARRACASRPYPKREGDGGALGAASASVATTLDGFTYDSRQEARMAKLFGALGYAFQPQPRAFPTPLGEWRIDFYVCDARRAYYVEVKPTYPLVTEQQRCFAAAHHTDVPVVVLYGALRPPFCFPSKDHGATYERPAPGLLGMMWLRDGRAGGRVVRTEVAWRETEAAGIFLGGVDDVATDLTWNTPRLRAAYELAREVA